MKGEREILHLFLAPQTYMQEAIKYSLSTLHYDLQDTKPSEE